MLLSNPLRQWDILRSVKLIIHSRFLSGPCIFQTDFSPSLAQLCYKKPFPPPFLFLKRKKKLSKEKILIRNSFRSLKTCYSLYLLPKNIDAICRSLNPLTSKTLNGAVVGKEELTRICFSYLQFIFLETGYIHRFFFFLPSIVQGKKATSKTSTCIIYGLFRIPNLM